MASPTQNIVNVYLINIISTPVEPLEIVKQDDPWFQFIKGCIEEMLPGKPDPAPLVMKILLLRAWFETILKIMKHNPVPDQGERDNQCGLP